MHRNHRRFVESIDTTVGHILSHESRVRLIRSSHNEYPIDIAMPQVDMSSDAVNELCRIIVKYKYQRFIRLRSLHRHHNLEEGHILLQKRIPPGYWTEPTSVQEVDINQIYGQVFSVSEGGLFPTEFSCGPSQLALDVNFAKELTQALLRNNLHTILGIEIARDGKRGNMVEFSDDSGSALVPEDRVNLVEQETIQYTGWVVTDDGLVDRTGETRCHIMNGQHTPIKTGTAKGVWELMASSADRCM